VGTSGRLALSGDGFSIRLRDDDQIGPVADRAGRGVGEEAALYGWVADALMADATTSDHARRLITGARVVADAVMRTVPAQSCGGNGGRFPPHPTYCAIPSGLHSGV